MRRKGNTRGKILRFTQGAEQTKPDSVFTLQEGGGIGHWRFILNFACAIKVERFPIIAEVVE